MRLRSLFVLIPCLALLTACPDDSTGDDEVASTDESQDTEESSDDADTTSDTDATETGSDDETTETTDDGTTDETTDDETTDDTTTEDGTTDDGCPVGTLGCPCDEGVCDVGECVEGICVEVETCDGIEGTYNALVQNSMGCSDDGDCHVLNGHCGTGLGGCYYTVNVALTQGDLDALAGAWNGMECQGPVCDCAPPPEQAVCVDNTCVEG